VTFLNLFSRSKPMSPTSPSPTTPTPAQVRAIVRDARPGNGKAKDFADRIAENLEVLGWEVASDHLTAALGGADPLEAELAELVLTTLTTPGA
jgi:hypothetical protein